MSSGHNLYLLAAPFSHTILGCFSAAIKKKKKKKKSQKFSAWSFEHYYCSTFFRLGTQVPPIIILFLKIHFSSLKKKKLMKFQQ